MTTISIIQIDLGDINQLIAEDVAKLTGKAAEELDNAISAQKALQVVKDRKQVEKQQAEDAYTTVMTTIYDQLVIAGDTGIPVAEVMTAATAVVTTASAFSLRMKHFLKDKGNQYALLRKQRKGTPVYIFATYNQTEEPEHVEQETTN